MNPKIVVVGNIGASKSTILDIAGILGYDTVPEPVNNFLDTLELYYRDKVRWSFTLQMDCFISRAIKWWDKCQELINKDGVVTFFERDTLEDSVFAKTCHDLGFMSDLEYKKYTTWSREIRNRLFFPPSAYLIVKTPPEICERRKDTRNALQTAAEKQSDGVFLNYLQALDKNYTAFPQTVVGAYGRLVPVFTIDSTVYDYSLKEDKKTPNNIDGFNWMKRHLENMVETIMGKNLIFCEQ
jgi:deoxyadenosine/deoxycytidine kinase